MESSICLQRSESDLREFILAVIAVEVFMAVFFIENKVYDLSTAMIFAFLFGFLARGKLKEYYLLFPLACLNRETTFLMVIFFAVYFVKRLGIRDWAGGVAYQGSVFTGIRSMIVKIFEENPGQTFYFQPWQVLTKYWSHPISSLVLFVLVAVTWYFVARRWKEKPVFLRSALAVMFPLQVVLHLALGAPYEIRVFAEVYPVVWLMMFQVPGLRFQVKKSIDKHAARV